MPNLKLYRCITYEYFWRYVTFARNQCISHLVENVLNVHLSTIHPVLESYDSAESGVRVHYCFQAHVKLTFRHDTPLENCRLLMQHIAMP
jgi:hypothetical protein